MGNMLPCLVQQGATALPAMNPNKQRLVSLKLLVKTVHKMKKRSNDKAKLDSKSSSLSAEAASGEGKGGGEVEVVMSKQASSSNNPKRAVLRSRLHGRSGLKTKGAVRVKVVLTKEEAARLLSLTVGGQKTATQIVAEIKRMEARRAANAAWRPALESIPEESS